MASFARARPAWRSARCWPSVTSWPPNPMAIFDARHHRADGALDPSGVVKGWSVDEAALLLDAAGARNFAINAGGDILVRGEPAAGSRMARRDPPSRSSPTGWPGFSRCAAGRLRPPRPTSAATISGCPAATRRRASCCSVTVVGPSLTYADAYATTAFAMGLAGLDWVARHPGYGVYAITADERVLWSPAVGPCWLDPAPPDPPLLRSRDALHGPRRSRAIPPTRHLRVTAALGGFSLVCRRLRGALHARSGPR